MMQTSCRIHLEDVLFALYYPRPSVTWSQASVLHWYPLLLCLEYHLLCFPSRVLTSIPKVSNGSMPPSL